jgi:phospholipase/carboxylesterase
MPANLPSLPLHYLLRPASMPTDEPALLILLHGVGSNERDLFGLAADLDPRFTVISLRAPMTLPYGGYGWYPVQFTPQGPKIDINEAMKGQVILNQFIEQAQAAFEVSPKRTLLMGFSQGAIMSLNTMLTAPESIGGVVAMSGRLLPNAEPHYAAPERVDGFPVTVVHGTFDDVLPISDGRLVYVTLSKLPVRMTYKEYPMGHHISDASFDDIQVWLADWLG